ncbi:2OG-Fe(II) oxygenase [Oleisolibacter albus]|uniref:2OG-Fe(II) oxygenase n=1 Tax=Oleisolibacter albus TaxID=2171757 RepID=UPI001EFCAFEE|nr:2OG-Fe(II) oxygenase [Oleisolibacter albus]
MLDISLPVSTPPGATAKHLHHVLEACNQQEWPFRHWLLTQVLPADAAKAVHGLPWQPPAIDDTQGRRETHNASRRFFNAEARQQFAVAADVAEALQHPETVGLLSRRCGVALKGSFLRIEYCQDTAGFWLEPHTDIGAKLFTMLIYLSTEADADQWGTDIYADPAKPPVGRANAAFNRGLIFVPGTDTWHGFEPRTIRGVRRTLIVNYVKPEWRSRHELAYPDQPVG